MTTDKMRKAIPEEFHEWNSGIAGNENQEICRYRLQGWQAACASNAAEIINLHEVNRSLRDSNADMLRHFKSNEQQFAAANEKIKVALEALLAALVAINATGIKWPVVTDAIKKIDEAITQIEEARK